MNIDGIILQIIIEQQQKINDLNNEIAGLKAFIESVSSVNETTAND